MGLDIDSIVNPFLAVNATRLATATGVLTRGRPTLLSSFTSPAVLLALSVAYLALCSALRFRHEKAMRRRFNYPDRASFSRMTSDDAQAIIADLMSYEFPLLYKTSLQFAIFKTYGVESISRLLAATGSFSDPRSAPKRYQDTTVIFGQFQMNKPTSEPCIQAISRMNYLHSQYKKAGKISNQDFLYTLSVCASEPIRFIRLYEWRELNEMEINAIGCFWKGMGDAMGIEYRGYLSKDSWVDGTDFLDDMLTWAKRYEIDSMKPSHINTVPAYSLVDMLLYQLSGPVKAFVIQVLTVLMGDRMREAFLYPEPSIFASLVAIGALNIRRFALRYLLLPRISPLTFFSEPDPTTGRVQLFDWLVEPHYVKPSFWNRWGPISLVTRALGGHVPGSSGGHFMPEGFVPEDLGPEPRRGKGKAETDEGARRLRKERTAGCPFSMGRA